MDQGVMLVVGEDGCRDGVDVEFPRVHGDGRCLKAIPIIKDYWFDRQRYHPDTTVFKR